MVSVYFVLSAALIQAIINTFGIALYNSICKSSYKPFTGHANVYVRALFTAINIIPLFLLLQYGFNVIFVFVGMFGLY